MTNAWPPVTGIFICPQIGDQRQRSLVTAGVSVGELEDAWPGCPGDACAAVLHLVWRGRAPGGLVSAAVGRDEAGAAA